MTTFGDRDIDRLTVLRRAVHAEDVVLTDDEIDELGRLEVAFQEHLAGLQHQQLAGGYDDVGAALARLRGNRRRVQGDRHDRGVARIRAGLDRR